MQFTLLYINYIIFDEYVVYFSFALFDLSKICQNYRFQVGSMNRVYRLVLPVVILQQFPRKTTNSFFVFASLFLSFLLSLFPPLFLFLSRESTVTTDLYTLARGVKLTRVGKSATLRADQCVNAERMIYPSPLAMHRVSRRFPFPTLQSRS